MIRPDGDPFSLSQRRNTMTTLIAVHEVKDGEHWAKAWKKGAGSRHELFAKIGIKAKTFRSTDNPNLTGLILEVPDMKQMQVFMESDEARKAMKEDGIKVETLRFLSEIAP
jgi:hypothetical protein